MKMEKNDFNWIYTLKIIYSQTEYCLWDITNILNQFEDWENNEVKTIKNRENKTCPICDGLLINGICELHGDQGMVGEVIVDIKTMDEHDFKELKDFKEIKKYKILNKRTNEKKVLEKL